MAKWCIDYGHGGTDPGACNGSRKEKEDVKRVGDKVVEYLKYNGQSVILSRGSDVYIKPYDRTVYANTNKADYFISLHRNSATDSSANGLETYAEVGAVKGKALAQAIQREIMNVVPYRDRGYKEANFTVLAYTNMPSILTELGFISNATDNELFDKYLEETAHAIAKACIEYVGGSYKRKGTNTSPSTNNASTGKKTMYRVMCGSFSEKANAEARKKAVDSKPGYYSCLVAETGIGKLMYRVVCGSFESKANAEARSSEVRKKSGFDCFLVATKV